MWPEMRTAIFLVLISGPMMGCSSGADIRSHLKGESENDLPDGAIADNETVFIEVRGDQYERGGRTSDFGTKNVFLELKPDGMVYSRRYSVTWIGSAPVPTKQVAELDNRQLSADEHQRLLQRLVAYRPPDNGNADVALTPRGCEIPIDSVAGAIVSFGSEFFDAEPRFVFPGSCNSPSGEVIKQDLNDILADIPPLEGLGSYIID